MGPESAVIPAETTPGAGLTELLIALPACRSAAALERALAALPSLLPAKTGAGNIVVIHPDIHPDIPPNTAGRVPSGPAGLPGSSFLKVVPYPLPSEDPYGDLSQTQTLRSLLEMNQKIAARVCAVIGSDLGAISTRDFALLLQPVLQDGSDLTVPNYAEKQFDGLINRSVIRPFFRTMYGQRVRFPMATDFVFSARLAETLADSDGAQPRSLPLPAVAACAIRAGFKICEANVGFVMPARDAGELSSVLAQMLEWLFSDLNENAGFWQRIRGSQPVTVYGPTQNPEEEPGAASEGRKLDVQKMIDTFQRGLRDLFEVWASVLPPATLLDLKKLAKVPAGTFRMPDAVWARLLYDFALAYRQRVINRDHLLRSLTPAYLAWVASYALEVQGASAIQVEERLERLYLTFEASKPYLLSRWRWPDRFNP